MLRYAIVVGALHYFVTAEPPVQGVKSTDVLSSSDHTSFSFIRPGLTQTSYAFSGPSSHQSFSSSIGNPQLAQKVLPNLAQALAYRNPALGYYPINPVANNYGIAPTFATSAAGPLTYQVAVDPASALAYVQQQQQQQQQQQAHLYGYQPNAAYQAQLAQLLALRQAQAQVQQEQLRALQPQQAQLQQQQEEQSERQSQNLLGVAYSSAPSVAHVKVSGNGYKFDF